MLEEVVKYLPDVDPSSFDAEDSKICMFCKDKGGKFIWANKGFLGYFHLSLPQIIGRTEDELNLAEDTVGLAEDEEDVLKNGQYIKKLIDLIADGVRREALYTEFPLFDKERSIIGLMGFFMDVTGYRRVKEDWKTNALTDDLTGLWNRDAWEEEIAKDLNKPTYVAFFDLDHFKEQNDTYGHEYGDAFLKKFAEELKKAFGVEHCFRYGGDEFFVLGSFTSEDDIRDRYETLKKALTGVDILERKGININTSCGFVYKTPRSKEEKKMMLHDADARLYEAKHAGRNQIAGKAI